MDHPARTEPGQGLVDAKRRRFPPLLGAAVLILSLVDPGGKEGAILTDNDAVIDHRRIIEQVGQAGFLTAMAFKRRIRPGRTQPQAEQQQQKRSERCNRRGEGGNHW